MKRVIIDAMTVIHLSKITLLRSLVENVEVVIPRRVFEEAVKDSLGRYNDALFGTPSIVRWMFEEGVMDKKKAIEGLEELKKIGWFERGLLDRIIGEVEVDG